MNRIGGDQVASLGPVDRSLAAEGPVEIDEERAVPAVIPEKHSKWDPVAEVRIHVGDVVEIVDVQRVDRATVPALVQQAELASELDPDRGMDRPELPRGRSVIRTGGDPKPLEYALRVSIARDRHGRIFPSLPYPS